MKKIIPFIVFLCCLTTVLQAQLDTFNLSRYKLPDIKFRQLDLNFNLDGTNALDKTRTEDNSVKYSSMESNNYLNLGYRSYRNSEHLQNEQEFRIGVNPSFSNRKNDGDITYKNSVIGTYYNLTSRNRIYYQNQFFFEPDFVLNGSLKERKEDVKSQFSLMKTRDNAMQIRVPLLVGHGRIEQIQDARLAVYILEELQKAGRISKMPTNEDILEFSRLISGLKNERFFDYRLRKMIEMEKVDSFLQAKEFISSPDVRYYTIVDDNWEYAQGPVRESGNRLSAGLVPEFRYYYTDEKTTYTSPDDTSEQKNIRKTAGIKLQTMYESEKPLNLHWQRSMSATLSYGYSKNLNTNQLSENPERKSDTDELTLEAAFDYGMGYHPNSRTDITGLFSLDFQQFNKKENLDQPLEKLKGYGIDPRISFVLNYYISPQFRLNLNYELGYFYSNQDVKYAYDTEFNYIKSNALTQSFSAGFIYSFF